MEKTAVAKKQSDGRMVFVEMRLCPPHPVITPRFNKFFLSLSGSVSDCGWVWATGAFPVLSHVQGSTHAVDEKSWIEQFCILHYAIERFWGFFCGHAVWHLNGFPSPCTRAQINLFHPFDSCGDLGAGVHNTSSLQHGSVFTRWIRCYRRLERASFILHFIFCGSHSHSAWRPQSNLQIQTFKLVADVQYFSCQPSFLLFASSSSVTWHARWNVSRRRWIYFTCPSGKEPEESILKRVTWRNLCEVHFNWTSQTFCCQLNQVTTTRGLLLIGGATLGVRPLSDKLRCSAVFN